MPATLACSYAFSQKANWTSVRPLPATRFPPTQSGQDLPHEGARSNVIPLWFVPHWSVERAKLEVPFPRPACPEMTYNGDEAFRATELIARLPKIGTVGESCRFTKVTSGYTGCKPHVKPELRPENRLRTCCDTLLL